MIRPRLCGAVLCTAVLILASSVAGAQAPPKVEPEAFELPHRQALADPPAADRNADAAPAPRKTADASTRPVPGPKEGPPPRREGESVAPPPSPGPDEGAKPKPVREAPDSPAADPTAPSPRLKNILDPPKPKDDEARPVQPTQVPELLVKGIVSVEGKEPGAVLEVKGSGRYSVRPGDRVTVRAGDAVLTLCVKGIANGAVTVEVPELKQTFAVK